MQSVKYISTLFHILKGDVEYGVLSTDEGQDVAFLLLGLLRFMNQDMFVYQEYDPNTHGLSSVKTFRTPELEEYSESVMKVRAVFKEDMMPEFFECIVDRNLRVKFVENMIDLIGMENHNFFTPDELKKFVRKSYTYYFSKVNKYCDSIKLSCTDINVLKNIHTALENRSSVDAAYSKPVFVHLVNRWIWGHVNNIFNTKFVPVKLHSIYE